jgi:hypothetical protein
MPSASAGRGVKHLFADGAYDRRQLLDKAAYLDFVIEVIRSYRGWLCHPAVLQIFRLS